MRIWFLKGSTGKSRLFEQLCRGSHEPTPKTLMVDLVGVHFNLSDGLAIRVNGLSRENWYEVKKFLVKLFDQVVNDNEYDVRDMYIYGNFPAHFMNNLVEITEPYTNNFSVWYTIQTEKGDFELVQHIPISY